MRLANPRLPALLLGLVLLAVGQPQAATADPYADVLVSYAPVIKSGQPTPPFRRAVNALGAPNFAGADVCADSLSCTFVSLGDGGTIILKFVDNALSGSGSSAADLRIYEIGPDVEDTFVAISADGVTWHPVGKVAGSISTVDIDAYGYGINDRFYYVRLTDDTNEGSQTGANVGADIDAIEALSSVPVASRPTTWGLLKVRY